MNSNPCLLWTIVYWTLWNCYIIAIINNNSNVLAVQFSIFMYTWQGYEVQNKILYILSNAGGENEGQSECKNVSSLVAMVTLPTFVTIELLWMMWPPLYPCLWGYRVYPGYMAIRVPRFRFVIASHRDFHIFHGAEMYCWTHETGFHGYRISMVTTNCTTGLALGIVTSRSVFMVTVFLWLRWCSVWNWITTWHPLITGFQRLRSYNKGVLLCVSNAGLLR